jgi:hypothetical protein
LLEAFQKPAKLALARFQKWWALCSPLSKQNCSSQTYLPDFKTREITPPFVFQMLLVQLPRNLLSSRSKGFDLACFEKLSAN